MAVIAKAVEVIDVPLDRDQSLLLNVNRMQIYRLAAIDPEPLVKTLQDSGDLDPTTRLEADRKNKAIIAYAPLTDHLTIRTLVEKLDGSGRQFEVIRLRRLEADYVAGTITFMMGQEEKKEERPRYYGFYDDRRRSSEDESQRQVPRGRRRREQSAADVGQRHRDGGSPQTAGQAGRNPGRGRQPGSGPRDRRGNRRRHAATAGADSPGLALVGPQPDRPAAAPRRCRNRIGRRWNRVTATQPVATRKPASAPESGPHSTPAAEPKTPPAQDSVEADARPAPYRQRWSDSPN